MFRKLYAKLTGGKPVLLQDWEGEIYKSIAYPNPFKSGEMYAHVYWSYKVGHVCLKPDGTTYGNTCYMCEWRFG
jgi:hypothetical protein